MPPARTDADRLVKSFRRSWMASRACVVAFDEDIEVRRNRRVLGDHVEAGAAGWRRDQAPFRAEAVVALVAMVFDDGALLDSPAASFAVALGCCLTGELLATVYAERELTGGIFEVADRNKDKRRHEKQLPLLLLRNTLCHPGFLPAPVNERSKIDGLLEVIRDDYENLRNRLKRSRLEITSIELGRWAVDRAHELGQLELCRLVVGKLRGRGVEITDGDARRLEQRAQFKVDLDAVLARLPGARSAYW